MYGEGNIKPDIAEFRNASLYDKQINRSIHTITVHNWKLLTCNKMKCYEGILTMVCDWLNEWKMTGHKYAEQEKYIYHNKTVK